MTKTVTVSRATGCSRSMMDAAHLVDYFRANGWRVTSGFENSDLILLGACGVTSLSENLSLSRIAKAAEKGGRDAKVIVFGCLPGINKEAIKKVPGVGALTKQELHQLDDVIKAEIPWRTVQDPNLLGEYRAYIDSSFSPFDKVLARMRPGSGFLLESLSYLRFGQRLNPPVAPGKETFCIRLASGCDAKCAYCAIRNSVGPFRSRPKDNLLKQFDDGLAKGYQEFLLMAEDVGAYGSDQGGTYIELLREILERKGDWQFEFDDFSPKWLIKHFDEFMELYSRHFKRFRYMGMPMQSGSEKVLGLMRREYKARDFLDCVKELRRVDPNLVLNTHAIIGFPGEDEDDFQATVDAVRQARFNFVEIYRYSDRPGAPAVHFPNKVPEMAKLRRCLRIREVGNLAAN